MRGQVHARTDILGIGPPAAQGPGPFRRLHQDFGPPPPPLTRGNSFGVHPDIGMVTDSLQRIQQGYQQAHTIDNGDLMMLGLVQTAPIMGMGGQFQQQGYRPSFGNQQQMTGAGNPAAPSPYPVNRPMRRGHVSMTADQMPDPRDLKAQHERELQEHIAARKAAQEARLQKEKQEDELIERRAREQQDRMRQEYEEEINRKRAREDARAARIDRMRKRAEDGQWGQAMPTNKPEPVPKPASGSSLNDMDKEFLGIKPPAAMVSSMTELIPPAPIDASPSPAGLGIQLIPPQAGGQVFDIGPEPGEEFIMQRARQLGINVPGGPGFMPGLAPDLPPLSNADSSVTPGFMMTEPLFLEPDPLLRGLKTM